VGVPHLKESRSLTAAVFCINVDVDELKRQFEMASELACDHLSPSKKRLTNSISSYNNTNGVQLFGDRHAVSLYDYGGHAFRGRTANYN
jgi:hypothetical protein